MRIRFLGPLEVTRDDASLTLPQSRKTRALLGYLALSGRPHSRERLVSIFWDVPDDPRGALRWSLSKLRTILDGEGRPRVVADRESVSLDLGDVATDLDEARAAAEGLAELPTEAIEAASRSFAGELMEGLDLPECHEYQFWLVAQRDAAKALKARLDRALVDRLSDDPARALPYAWALVDFDPFDQEAQAALITRLVQTGRKPEAEAQYKRALRDIEEAGETAEPLREAWRALAARPAARPRPQAPCAATLERARDAERERDAERLRDTERILRRPAVAVLPFDNMSGDPEQEYLADGITEDIITALSQWRWFPVIARASTLAYKNRHVQAETVGRELGARYVVQGSARRGADRVRVVVQLVDAESGLTTWAQRYDCELGDVFDLQDEIAARIVAGIEPELARAERLRSERRPDQRLGVWELNLRALHHIDRGNAEDLKRAQEIIERSLELEPRSSYTLSLSAYCMYHQALLVWTTTDPQQLAQSYLDTARRAVDLDDSNWLGHALLGMSVLWSQRDYASAESEELRAIELNPTAPLAHQFMGCIFNFSGRPSDAIPHLQASLRLNPGPGSATLLLADLALAHLLLDELDPAVSFARRAISTFSGNVRAKERLAAALGRQNRIDEARRVFEEMVARHGAPGRAYLDLTYPFKTDEHRAALRSGLEAAGLSL